MSKVYLVVNSDERVVGIFRSEREAHASALDGDVVAGLTGKDLETGEVPLFYLPKLSDYNPIDIQALGDVVDEHDTEIDEIFQRVSAIEEDIYGAERPLLHVEVDLEDDHNDLN